MRTRLVVYSLLLVVLTFAAWIVHVHASTPLQIDRWRYPLDSLAVRWTTECDKGAPAWLKDSLNELVTVSYSPANQIAYVALDGQVSECHNGWREGVLQGERVTDTTSFRIASLTKLFTGLLAMRAQAEGRLALDRPVLELLPDIAPPKDSAGSWRAMRGVDLLRHTTGFDRMRQPDPMLTADERPDCPYELARVSRYRLDFEPGTHYAYSNLGYCLVGVALEQAYGEPFRQLLLDRFGKAARTMPSFVDGPYAADEVVYDTRYSDFWGADYWRHFDFPALSSAAGLRTNATDLARMIAAEKVSIQQFLPLANQFALKGQDCSKFMRCYGLLGAHFDDGRQRANIWRGNLVGSASMVVFLENGAVLVWLGAGAGPQQARHDEHMFRRWLAHM